MDDDVEPTIHSFWLVALIGGCVEAAEYARGHHDPRAALANASAAYREWLLRLLDGSGYGNGHGSGGGNGGGGGFGHGYGGGDGGDGDGGDGGGFGGGNGFGFGGGDGAGSGYGYAPPLRVRVGGEWWDRDRALVWIAEALK